MKIALLTNGVFPFIVGGMQKHSFCLAKNLANIGIDVVIYHYVPMNSIVQDSCFPDTNHIKVVTVTYPRRRHFIGHYLWESYQYSVAILKEYERSDLSVDFIYAQGLTGWAFINAKNSGKTLPPIGVNLHGYEMFQRSIGLRGKLEQCLLRPSFSFVTRQADYVFSFSGKIREIIEKKLGVPATKIIEMPNAIDDSWLVKSHLKKNERNQLRFVYIGRYERRKGIIELHKAIKMLGECFCEFHFVGPIPQSVQLRQSNVVYHGLLTDSAEIKEILDQSDVLLCASYSEGMPTVILEAMARGLAIIATDVGANCSMVSNENGVLLSKLTVLSLRNAIQKIASMDGSEIVKLKMASLEKVKNFTWKNVAERTASEIRRCSK